MLPYLLDVALTAWISSGIINSCDGNEIERYRNRRKKIILLGLLLFLWVLIFALRGTTGSDADGYRFNYVSIYKSGKTLDVLLSANRDKLYQVLIYYCSNISKGSWVFGSFVMGCLVYFPVIYVIEKESPDINFSCLVYIFTLSAFFSFNGIRQGLSISFAFFAYYCFLRKKKFIRYALFMVVAYGFHASALLIVPFHLLSQKKLKSLSTIILLIAAVISTFFIVRFWGNVVGLFGNDDLVSRYKDTFSVTQGSSILRAIFWVMPAIIAIWYYSKVKEHSSDIDSDIILVIFGAVFMLYSVLSVSFSQMASYFTVSSIVLLPKIIFSLDEIRHGNLKRIILVVLFLYMIVMLRNGDMGLNPYTPVWESNTY